MLRFLATVLLALTWPVGRGVGQEPVPGGPFPASEPLSLEQVLEVVEARNPTLRASRARIGAMAAREPGSTLPPDPMLQVGFMNASLPGLRFDMPASMRPSLQLMQRLPFPGTLRLEGEMARRETALAGAMAGETGWEVRTWAVMAFLEIWRADRRIEVIHETLEWLARFEEVAVARYSVGGGRQGDVLRAGVEVARMEAELVRMQSMRRVAADRLNAVMDQQPGTPVSEVILPPLPAELPGREELERWAGEGAPPLARGRLEVEQARTATALARRELWPDLAVGVQYGERPTEMGTERMGSVMLEVELPVFAGRRQLQRRREAAALAEAAEAELAWTRAESSARIGGLLAELEEARTLVTLYRTAILPQAEANVLAALSAYRVGQVDFLTLVEGQVAVNQHRQELHDLMADYGLLVAELEMTVGRTLPPTSLLPAEDP
jgi:outer membrane protein, heavy metal efflux system